MPLLSCMTLSRYIKKLNPAYGISQETFEIMGMKSKNMRTAEKHSRVFYFSTVFSSYEIEYNRLIYYIN